MNIIHLLRSRCSAGEEERKEKHVCAQLKLNRNFHINVFICKLKSYLDVSGVSLQDRQTQHQEEELLSESALHNAHLCLQGAPEPRKSELLRDQRCFI